MAQGKKKIPLNVRLALEELLANRNELVHINTDGNYIVNIEDSDKDSDYFFRIEDYSISSGKVYYRFVMKPQSGDSLDVANYNVIIGALESIFKNWLNIVENSNKHSFLFDETYAEHYYNDLESQFKIIDKDANTSPYSIPQIRLINKFLDEAHEIIYEQKDLEEAQKEEAILLIEDTKNTITTTIKQKVADNVRLIIAKAYSFSFPVGEKLLVNFLTEYMKKLISEGI